MTAQTFRGLLIISGIFANLLLTASACQSGTKKKDDAPVINTSLLGPSVVVATPGSPKPTAGPTTTPATSPSAAPTASTTGPAEALVARQVTTLGASSDARFSPDGSKIIYVSRGRAAHSHSQAYEMSLSNMIEKRVTYHDGDVRAPAYIADGSHMVYASETDEQKEEPAAIDKLMKQYYPSGAKGKSREALIGGPTEVYLQSLNGRVLERLTRSPGFDGEPDSDPKGKRLAFISARGGKPALYLMNLPASDARRLTDGKGSDRSPRFSADARSLAWSRQADENGPALIYLSENDFKGSKALTSGKGTFLDLQPTWHPGGQELVFTSNRDSKAFNLYSIDREGKCLKRLTNVGFDQMQPAFSPDGKKLVFTGNREVSGVRQTQIYLMDYTPPASCL